MPRISEANLEEHRRNTMNALLDCAEHIAKTQGNNALTPAAVSQGAGIARNSIYRYVDNMDDLRHKLLQRHLPDWRKALEDGLAGVSDPVEIIAIWVRINLEQTSIHGHGWMMKLHPTGGAAARKPKPDAKTDVSNDGSEDKPDFHATIAMPVARAWRQLCPHSPRVGATITRGLVSSGMRLLESAHDDAQARAIITQVEQAARAMAQSMREDDDAADGTGRITSM
ncbi:MAG: TetR/AcrR family transcriptional regulator [Bifidobacterium tibiigranuli]|jgi:AcrR family transcriptional regulator|uniref:TetR/AcrR family transcriptional regulator n=1 Tax=Bifidobacterium tibiigranuli TaxID=2172043 RepID=UPI002352EB2E|nr:TetR/AcrR family transcriptional regulator [Bifidobacterium tibiigranuli]MCH3973577.1 TetR/AcrR family transcriptional regulator [Bifidobacterium tibiigranuli]MCH4189765.1 TetR/AcrR family transcriptional regulator [Bifidobacterium tibiigranuli]MCH4204678.1 TetR/AcrR family transcriptional regulator [Bifidobacterium tibiigranuli]MCH4275412.1 TetR/AcrR family transcriptional regulator [Bifidobacterium tibiigranuli]MCI1791871.1 TetR/AcrR family transcriptional regulator [Bifidobacterium tibii